MERGLTRLLSACAGRGLGARVSLMFAAMFVIAGTQLPYLPIWLDWAGLNAGEIAGIAAMPMVVRVVITPVVAFAADRSGDHRRFLIGLAWAAMAVALVLGQTRGFWPILLLSLMFAVAVSTIMPLTETVAMRGVRSAGLDYGRMRLWGSLSFIAASFCGGFAIARLGASAVIWMLAGGATLTALAAHGLSGASAAVGETVAKGNDTPSAAGKPRLSLADAMGLMRSRLFLAFLLAVGAVQAAHATFYAFGTLHWAAQGISSSWAGTLWAIGVTVEIALMAFSGAVVRRVGAAELIVLGALASVLRWLAMGFDPPLAALIWLQALHGLTYGATHIGAFYLMTRTVPEPQAGTAQALYASITAGIAMGGAMLVSGQLYATWGGRTYWAMAALAAIGLVASVAVRRMWKRSQTGPDPQGLTPSPPELR
ncbi:MAG TPA: MFS transporter [Hyphomicrobiaceae bacterium]|nr:MFS transporter [Hyphomicrobiaceae bacterium]